MAKTPHTILDAIKGGEELNNQGPNTPTEGQPEQGPQTDEKPDTETQPAEQPKATAWGAFKIETGIEPPAGVKRGGTAKYDWASFPAPSNPNDPKTWPSVFIPDIGSNSISGSIKAFRDKVQKEGKVAPEFGVTVIVGQEATPAVEAVEATDTTPAIPAQPAKPFIQKGVRVFRKS